ncbi:MAG: DUF2306 domain-containing protein [Saprospiraceae bacterium]
MKALAQKWFRVAAYTVGIAFLVAMTAFTGVMLSKVLPYLHFERAAFFLGTKPDAVLDKLHFTIGFYVHITTSLVVLALGITQFLPQITRRWPRTHRLAGQLYTAGILLLAAPSGLILATYANGGLPAKVGFSLQCLVWWVVTYLAWREARQKRWLKHVEMMIRSYAITLAAMSLRTESYILYYWFGTKPIETYVTVTWLSWVGNLLLAEVLLYTGVASKLLGPALRRSI